MKSLTRTPRRFGRRTGKTQTFTREGLRIQGQKLAESHKHATVKAVGQKLFRHLEDICGDLEASYQRLLQALKLSESLTPGVEWFLDNYHVVEKHILDIRKHFPKSYDRTLPKLKSGDYSGYPRVYPATLELMVLTDSVLDLGMLSSFVDGYQTEIELTIGEVWAVPICLRFALLESLNELTERMIQEMEEKNRAQLVVDEIVGDEERQGTEILRLLAARVSEEPWFLSHGAAGLIRRLRDRGPQASLTVQWLEAKLREDGTDPEEVLRLEQFSLAADQVSIANTITSLKTLSYVDWKEWFESISKVDLELSLDPTRLYGKSDFNTRDRCRKHIERIAKRSELNERQIAAKALALAEHGASSDKHSAQASVIYYFLDPGVSQLEQACNYQPVFKEKIGQWISKQPFFFYFNGIILLTILILFEAVSYSVTQGATLIAAVVTGLLYVIPASDLANNIVQWVVTKFSSPRLLPRLEFDRGIPDNCRTVVIAHSIFSSRDATQKTIDGLYIRYLANDDKNLIYGVLADLPDAQTETVESDQAIIHFANELIESLNARVGRKCFFVLFRRRIWNPAEGKFMAWERKRGKLEEFNALILGASETSFINPQPVQAMIRDLPFVITLDNDTQLPKGSAEKLIATIAHPLNRAVIDPEKKTVVSGYGILQPRVSVSLLSAHATLFSRIFCGHAGLDPYTQSVSDVYQDFFGEANYVGKGIYDVHAFETALAGRVPENALLSHDLFEGNFARTGLVSDIELFDDFPSKYHVYARRQHRWVRGDWQLLPWLFSKVPVRSEGDKSTSQVTVLNDLSRWKILDNLRRSLVAPSLFLLCIAGLLYLPGEPLHWLLFTFLVIAFPVYTNLAQGLVMPPRGLSVESHVFGIGKGIFRSLKQAGFSFCFLPYQAYLMLHAALITLWRVYISKKHLLEWETAYSAEKRMSSNVKSFLAEMKYALLVTALTAGLGVYFRFIETAQTLPFLLLWLSSPWIAALISKPIEDNKPELDQKAIEYLGQLAADTWQYFLQYLTPEHNYLIPDNIQLEPQIAIANRTSPTNISLSLLTVIAARDLELIPDEQALDLVEAIFSSIDKLEKHNGHLLNWYATTTLESLHPKYISTVDSGNFVGHLRTLHVALGQIAATNPAAFLERTAKLQQRIECFVDNIDFTFLFDRERNLFVIGYNVESARRDQSYYDLLASEARLASYIAVASGQVSEKHWFALGRGLTETPAGKTLLSWSGTMFEYLMPLLVMKSFPETLLTESYRVVVDAQREYASRFNLPWGISESAYSGVDFEKTYQYRAFGVPGLGLKRGLENDLVISPYSTVLALLVSPKHALSNLRALEQAGARGKFGFYEALDYTPSRLAPHEKSHAVKAHFAHHQGMSMVALANLLKENIFQKRFHADPRMRAFDLLLQERFPERLPTIGSAATIKSPLDEKHGDLGETVIQTVTTPHSYIPHTHFLSNGRYALMVDNVGSGFSSFDKELILTRWREDLVENRQGFYIYIQDVAAEKTWSVGYQPTCVQSERYEAVFGPDKVEIKREDQGIYTHTEIIVSPEDDLEIRKITLANLGKTTKILDVTSYGEVVLATAKADLSHPAFSKLFVESEYLEDHDALLFKRRKRSEHDPEQYLLHLVTMKRVWARTQYESSRSRFIGRGGSLRRPLACEPGEQLAGNSGTVLDPIFALRVRVELQPGETESVSFISAFGNSREDLLDIANRFRDVFHVSRAFEMAWSQSSVELRSERFTAKQTHTFQKLASAVLFNVPKLRANQEILLRNRLGQPGLWRFGISGDLPIVLARITEENQFALVQELLLAHYYLRSKGCIFELIFFNEYPGGYLQLLQEQIEMHVRSSLSGPLLERKGGVFVRNVLQLSDVERDLLLSVSRVVLVGSRGNLSQQLKFDELEEQDARLLNAPAPARDHTAAFNFSSDSAGGSEFSFEVTPRLLPPLPWTNVIANQHFGTLVTEVGAGYTWSENSRENRLTPWSNDPVIDPIAEVIYLRQKSGKVFCPTARPLQSSASYQVTHSFGRSSYASKHGDLQTKLTQFVAQTAAIKYFELEIENTAKTAEELVVYFYVDPLIGVFRQDNSRFIRTGFNPTAQVLHAENPYNQEFQGRIIFIGSSEKVLSYSSDKTEVIGKNRDTASPLMLQSEENLSGAIGLSQDPCLCLQVKIAINGNSSKRLYFYLGETQSIQLLEASRDTQLPAESIVNESQAITTHWSNLVSDIEVQTPDPAFDLIMNGWLKYQVLASRLYGRTGYYQSGGAFGFRDQLQDVLSFLITHPEIVRNQILLHASRQFPEGDVQHWWHPPSGRGVRTKISDDYLWLPYVVARYLEATGDQDLLHEEVGFIHAPILSDHEHEQYLMPQTIAQKASVYLHCKLALERGFKLRSIRGLPLMGIGDWNDGMNEVGKGGHGESIWLGWFLADTAKRFVNVAKAFGDDTFAQFLVTGSQDLRHAIETHAWDGKWYRRAYFDDGTPLGSTENDECQIDSLSQSWAVISELADSGRAEQALNQAVERLVDREHRIIKVLDPAFDNGRLQPGYIKGYPAGIRENGGQYTHAACWLVMARAMQGKGNEAHELFSMLNPITHATSHKLIGCYQTEPYVLCGDVYSAPGLEGRGGWSWYSGSASWLYQVGLEWIVGLKVKADGFTLDPVIPEDWAQFSVNWKRQGQVFKISLENPSRRERGVKEISINGEKVRGAFVSFAECRGAEVQIKVLLG
ncbi:carbohydrate-binding protein [bacterium]|nr:carbohydrate-binding protein [bacterium]